MPTFPINKYIAMFLVGVISLDKDKFKYGRQYRLKHFKKHKVKLPAKDDKPDFEYMEAYIKSLPYSDRL